MSARRLILAVIVASIGAGTAYAQVDIASCGDVHRGTVATVLSPGRNVTGTATTSRDYGVCPLLLEAWLDLTIQGSVRKAHATAPFNAEATEINAPRTYDAVDGTAVGDHAMTVYWGMVPVPIFWTSYASTYSNFSLPEYIPGGGDGGGGRDRDPGDCDVETDPTCNDSPILIDMGGNGYQLTSAAKGVLFDIDADGTPEMVAWTTPDSDDAWLARDRNGNGKIDDGSELFGNHTPAPVGHGLAPNGFQALSYMESAFDGPITSMPNDIIDDGDARWAALLLWTDTNHNGISEPDELRQVGPSSLRSIDTKATESKREDRYGNQFRLRAKAYFAEAAKTKAGKVKKTFAQDDDLPDDKPGLHPRFIYDVWLTHQ